MRLEFGVHVGRDVVMVHVEPAFRYPCCARKRVKLRKRRIGDEVSPDAPVTRPQRWVDEYSHPESLRHELTPLAREETRGVVFRGLVLLCRLSERDGNVVKRRLDLDLC